MQSTPIPTKSIDNILIIGENFNETISVPLATYETPLWASCNRGARIARLAGGIRVSLISSNMTRSVIFDCSNTTTALKIEQGIKNNFVFFQEVVAGQSRFAKLKEIYSEIVGNLLFLRFSFFCADASGHNMATASAEALMNEIQKKYPQAQYASISGNLCIDKKTSAVNAILGRGRRVIAELTIPEPILIKNLKTTAAKMVELNLRKNLIGSILAGSLRSANAHYANMLLAFYLATGQDAANIVEGSQGITHCESRNGDLYFSCTLPNLILGSVGNGKGGELKEVEENLKNLGCRENRAAGENADRLALICAAVVLCGELSLMAAQTNQGELMRAHKTLERKVSS